jgi:Tat protein translocase TatB subunit
MGFGNLGGGEILVILLVALLVLGPTKLPEVARQAGRAMSELRKVTAGFQREFHSALEDDDASERARRAPVAPTRPPLVHDLNRDDDGTDRPAGSEPAATAIPTAPDPEAPRSESDTDR